MTKLDLSGFIASGPFEPDDSPSAREDWFEDGTVRLTDFDLFSTTQAWLPTITISGTFPDGTTVLEYPPPPGVPLRILNVSRQGWLRWAVLDYSRKANGILTRTVHRRWWFVSGTIAGWWMRRQGAAKPTTWEPGEGPTLAVTMDNADAKFTRREKETSP